MQGRSLKVGDPERIRTADSNGVAEEWRAVPGWEGYYSVSNLARVRREAREPVGRRQKGRPARILSTRFHPLRRYAAVHLFRDGKCIDAYVHVLVAAAFLGPKPEGRDVNHIDGHRQHNAASNLEYVTRSENQRHALALGLRPSAAQRQLVLFQEAAHA